MAHWLLEGRPMLSFRLLSLSLVSSACGAAAVPVDGGVEGGSPAADVAVDRHDAPTDTAHADASFDSHPGDTRTDASLPDVPLDSHPGEPRRVSACSECTADEICAEVCDCCGIAPPPDSGITLMPSGHTECVPRRTDCASESACACTARAHGGFCSGDTILQPCA